MKNFLKRKLFIHDGYSWGFINYLAAVLPRFMRIFTLHGMEISHPSILIYDYNIFHVPPEQMVHTADKSLMQVFLQEIRPSAPSRHYLIVNAHFPEYLTEADGAFFMRHLAFLTTEYAMTVIALGNMNMDAEVMRGLCHRTRIPDPVANAEGFTSFPCVSHFQPPHYRTHVGIDHTRVQEGAREASFVAKVSDHILVTTAHASTAPRMVAPAQVFTGPDQDRITSLLRGINNHKLSAS